MARFSQRTIGDFLRRSDGAKSKAEKGREHEALLCYLLESVPGVRIHSRNVVNAARSEEIDVAAWNSKVRSGFDFLPNVILAEAKNWSKPVSSAEVAVFGNKLITKKLDFGILFASNGITGDPVAMTAANATVASFLQRGVHILVITREDVRNFRTTKDLVNLIQKRMCELIVAGLI